MRFILPGPRRRAKAEWRGAAYLEVDPKTKLTRDGKDFREVHPLGLVPTLRTDDGEVLTENAAILQYVADSFPKANLAPADRMGRARLQQWLCFIGTELHKALFVPLLDAKAPEGAKAYALEKGMPRVRGTGRASRRHSRKSGRSLWRSRRGTRPAIES